MEERADATEWAEEVVDELKTVEIDRPYMTAVLVEAALQETPIHPLKIAVNLDGTRYMITAKGYKTLIDLEEFVLTFKGADRHHYLSRVKHLFCQNPSDEGAYFVFEMDSGQWQHDTQSSAASSAQNKHSRNYMEDRNEANEWAEKVVNELKIPEIDRPYLVAVLVEVALQESTLHPLKIAVNPEGERYMITVKGYKSLIDLEAFVLTFKGTDRHHHLTRVKKLYIQNPPDEGAYFIIEMDSGKWQNETVGNNSHHKMPHRRRRKAD